MIYSFFFFLFSKKELYIAQIKINLINEIIKGDGLTYDAILGNKTRYWEQTFSTTLQKQEIIIHNSE